MTILFGILFGIFALITVLFFLFDDYGDYEELTTFAAILAVICLAIWLCALFIKPSSNKVPQNEVTTTQQMDTILVPRMDQKDLTILFLKSEIIKTESQFGHHNYSEHQVHRADSICNANTAIIDSLLNNANY